MYSFDQLENIQLFELLLPSINLNSSSLGIEYKLATLFV